MNYFGPRSAAERYAKGRPYFHPFIAQRIKQFLAIIEPLTSALDVGCGTGLSTIALRGVAQSIYGVDASAEMIALGCRENKIGYCVASAENLPFENCEFDLLTVSQAFHWFDPNRFLAEANRVLRPSGWLIAYDNYFSGRMIGRAEFSRWHNEYLARYPVPPRREITFTPENTDRYGFKFLKEERFENTIRFSLEGLVDYLVTQSNVIAQIEGGNEGVEEVRNWLTRIVEPIFDGADEQGFLFNAPIWYLKRTA